PGSDSSPVPAMPRGSLPLPNPNVIFGRQQVPQRAPNPNDPFPDMDPPRNDPRSDPRNDPRTRDPNRNPDPTKKNPQTAPRDDSLSGMLDNLYMMADSYLKELADRTGGQLYRADTVATLPQAFAAIASELRTQYLLGYYPTNKNGGDAY